MPAIAAPSFREISDHVTEARRQLAAGKSLSDLEPSQREAYLDVEAIKFETNCELAGLNPNSVAAAHVKSRPVVSLRSYRHFISRA